MSDNPKSDIEKAIEEIKSWTPALLGMGAQCTLETSKAQAMAISALRFKQYFDELYGQGLEVANWHKNGDLEPFDNFYEEALEELFENTMMER